MLSMTECVWDFQNNALWDFYNIPNYARYHYCVVITSYLWCSNQHVKI